MSDFAFIANGTIQPARFVQIDTSTNDKVIAASAATVPIIGVSQEWSNLAPTPGASSAAAVAGDSIRVYGLGKICYLQATSAGWTAGDRLTADSTGNGVTASGTQFYGAVAQDTLTGAGMGRVMVIIGKNP